MIIKGQSLIYKQEAIIIRTVDYSDTSQIFTLLTPNYGKIGLLAKGLKQPNNIYQSAMQTLSCINIVYDKKNTAQLATFRECSLCHIFLGLRNNLQCIYAALYCAELIREYATENEANPQIYKLLRYSLYKLSSQTSPRNVVLYFSWYLLYLEGFLPSFYQCMHCGQSILPNQKYIFLSNDGGICCNNCKSKDIKNYTIISSNALFQLQEILKGNQEVNMDTIQLTTSEFQELISCFILYIQNMLEKKISLFRYIQKLVD
jgi:DNA repair protein RecO (recombination protein O)